MSDKTETPPVSAINLGEVAKAGQNSATAFAHLHSRMFKDALKFNAELLDFARRRIGEDIKTTDRLSRCQSMTDAMEVMSSFYQQAVQEYAEETSNLVKLSRDAAVEAADELKTGSQTDQGSAQKT